LAVVVPVKSLGTANGVVACGYLLGPAVGTFAGGLIMAQYGWRAAFLTFGSLSLLWLLPWSRVKLPQGAVRRSDADTPTLRTVLKQSSLWGTALGSFSANYSFYFLLTWLPYYLVRDSGSSTREMAQIAGTAYVVNALSAMLAGWVTDRLIVAGRTPTIVYKATMAIAHVGNAVCMVCMALGSKPMALAAMFLFQVLVGGQSPAFYAVSQILAGPRAAGRWVGVQNTAASFAGVVAPAVTGYIIASTHHFTTAFLLAAAVTLSGLIGWLWMVPKVAELSWEEVSAPVPERRQEPLTG
jgi:MFS family permease